MYSLVAWEFVTLLNGNTAEMICGNKMPARCNRLFLLQILLLAQQQLLQQPENRAHNLQIHTIPTT
jgi:hypothetical protein